MPPTLAPLLAGVLIGGRSSRMGVPKALLEFAGRTFAEHVVQAALGLVERVVLLGDGPVAASLSRLPRVADVPGVPGPLGGILAALRAERGHAWLIAAVDLPRVTPAAVEWLVAQRRPEALAVIPTLDGKRPEPLLAIYEPGALGPLESLIEQRAGAGAAAPHRLAGLPQVLTPVAPADLAEAWMNVNTPEELRNARGGPPVAG